MCTACPKKATCVAPCEKLIAAAAIVGAQRKARVTVELMRMLEQRKKPAPPSSLDED